MWITFLSTLLVITLTSAEYLYDANPYAHYGEYASAYDNYKPTDYKFEYGVSDPHTGDHKSQWEVKENGVVRGAYSLLEPDGTTRVVEYYADDTGFHADVKKIGTAVHDAPHYGNLHPIAESHVADSLAYNGYGHGGFTHSYGAPIAAVAKIAAPVPIHAAPIAQVQHIAPVPQVIAPQIHHAGTPLNIDFDHHQQFYAQTPEHYPTPVLQHPAPFKISEEHFSPVVKVPTPHLVHQAPQVFHEGPQILQKAYENHNHHYQPEDVLIKTLNYPAPESVPQYYAKYLEPQVVKSYVEPQLVKTYAESQLLKSYSEPQLVKTYAEPQLVKTYAEPQLLKTYAEPQLVKISEPQVVKTFVEPQPQIIKSYGEPQVYLPAPSPTPILSKSYALPIHTAPKVTNPFTKFFAPLAKYFTPPAPKVAAVKVAPQQIYAAPAPAPVTKYISNDYADYQGYKPEVVVSSPHNYQSPAYSFSHEY